ncbi:hypothetical protein BGE01nite_21870 [Brevifollis gellanilyticus]|uniref:Uncharacterized protein n=1 Tax=Brevifollis gellanilyticus TaxID=748831 RepID=A0A512M832_9BACT|nr:hypothetical protein BGE01nite_21870 [Brevifollis gellanilyticus]
MKFHTSALATAIVSTALRFHRVPASTIASRNTSAANMCPVYGSTAQQAEASTNKVVSPQLNCPTTATATGTGGRGGLGEWVSEEFMVPWCL